MKLVYFGDGPWAQEALRRLLRESDIEVVAVLVRFVNPDQILSGIAQENGIPCEQPENINSPEFIDKMAALNCDLAVSMSYNQIFRQEILDVFPMGGINCHAGMLPKYRGRNILNWALINDEKEIGVTSHVINQKLDDGDILIQKSFPVSDDDDYGTVLEKAIALCPQVLCETVTGLRDGNLLPKKQQGEASYFVVRKEGDEYIEWHWPARRVFNFVRAITTPGPLARTWLELNDTYCEVKVIRVRESSDYITYIATEGAVIGISDHGNPVVKTGDTAVEILEYEIDHDSRKRLRVGDRLGLNVNKLLKDKILKGS